MRSVLRQFSNLREDNRKVMIPDYMLSGRKRQITVKIQAAPERFCQIWQSIFDKQQRRRHDNALPTL